MKKSNRSNVDPFIVMDVMEAARKAEQSGKKIFKLLFILNIRPCSNSFVG